ncbi:ABC transporter substrate-binding protein [Jatrophihabitans sp.]|uniref:ABC transporter substrate-binding protein n=1 Tax=Jatrophihabitans sp. TaxID=1932789 RepID=UPI0030C68797|nr:branched-chain amino acid transporter substrate-binding protein [Jatrophihabitans sp.]
MRVSGRTAAIGLMTVVSVSILAACSSSGSGGGGGSTTSGGSGTSASGSSGGAPVHIAILAPVSAPALAEAASDQINAAKAAAAVVNKAGGVLGHQVVIDVLDEAGSATTAVTKLNSALSGGNKPVAVIQSDGSNITAAVIPITTQHKILSFNFAGTDTSIDPSKFPYNFDLAPSFDSFAASFCPQLTALKAKTFGIIYTDDAFGDAEAPAIAAKCKAAGFTEAGSAKFPGTALDLTPQLSSIQSHKPDVLIASAYGAPAGYLLQGLNKLGWNVPVLGDAAVTGSAVITNSPPSGQLGTSLETNLRTLLYASEVSSDTSPELTSLISGMEALGPIKTNLGHANAYDAVMLAVDGIKAAGSTTDIAKVATAIQGLPAANQGTAVFPSYSFSATSHAFNPAASTFAFVRPTKLAHGQFQAS